MFRLKIIDFIQRNKYKFYEIGKKLVIVAMVVLIATIIFSSSNEVEEKEKQDNNKVVFKPTDTIIQGSDISEEEYKEDKNLVNKFLEYCNNAQIEKAYNLISEDCKEESYPTLEVFKENYYDTVFNRKRQCNLQSWISQGEYIVYRVRYTNDMLSTGVYDENDVYEDYITLNKRNNTERISIGSLVDANTCNVVTETNGLKATVIKKTTYVSYEEYEINIENKSSSTILLDDLSRTNTIKLKAEYDIEYAAYINKLYINDMIIKPGEEKRIKIRFKKYLSSNDESRSITFSNVIKDYDLYKLDKESFKDIISITIKVED